MKQISFGVITTTALALAAAPDAQAAFTGFTLGIPTTMTAGRWVWSVYANFSQADDRLVNLNGFQLISGNMGNVQHRDYGSSTWNPAWNLEDGPSWAGSDSWVSIDGVYMADLEQTTLNWPGGGSTIPSGAGWGQATGSAGVAAGAPLKIKIMQIAGTYLAPGSQHFAFSLNADWRDGINSPINSSTGQVAIPSPAALALLGLLGATSRRRR